MHSNLIQHDTIRLTASDEVQISAHVSRPDQAPLGALVVVQEIFGVNAHIRAVCDRWAQAGWLAIAPGFFDRLEPGLKLDYVPSGVAKGRALVDQLGFDAPLRDIGAAAQAVGAGLPCAVVGFCWGGSVAALAATRMGLPAVSYYGGRTLPYLHERPQAPLLMHFGELDPMIPPATVDRIRTVWGAAATLTSQPFAVHTYPAGHGFNRYGHPDHVPASAELAQARSEAFLRTALGR